VVVFVAFATFVAIFLAAFVVVVSCSFSFSKMTTVTCLFMLFMKW